MVAHSRCIGSSAHATSGPRTPASGTLCMGGGGAGNRGPTQRLSQAYKAHPCAPPSRMSMASSAAAEWPPAHKAGAWMLDTASQHT